METIRYNVNEGWLKAVRKTVIK